MSAKKSGNTKQISPAKNWFFTWNNYTLEDIELIKNCSSINKYIFQEETGKNGTKHLQGYIEFNDKVRPKNILSEKVHWEKPRDKQACIEYCSKVDTRTGATFTKGIKLPKPLKIISELYEWQQKIVDIINEEPDDRIIYWYWDGKGNKGKSALCKYICYKYNALVLCGKTDNAFHGVIKYKEDTGEYPDIILFDIPRTCMSYFNPTAMEKIKDGCFYSGKYEGGMVLMNSPHIICFANSEPDTSSMSMDRWRIVCLNEPKNFLSPSEEFMASGGFEN